MESGVESLKHPREVTVNLDQVILHTAAVLINISTHIKNPVIL